MQPIPAPPTILQIIPNLDTGGAELSTVEIASAIVAAGGRALVATGGGKLAQRITEAGGEIIAFPAASKNPLQMMANARALAQLIEHHAVDLVHARSRAPAWSALWAARQTKRPFITTYHGAYNERGPLKRAYNSVMAKGDIVIANSAYTAGLIRSRYGTPETRIRVIHRGVDPSVYDPDAITQDRLMNLRRAWAVDPTDRIVLLPARLTRWKGQGVLIEAMKRLASVPSPRVVAIMAGGDQGRSDYTRELTGLITDLGLTDNVRLVGHVDDMAAAFALADVSVIASIEPEAFGRTSIEAQMMGCPVIATNIGAPPETVLAPPRVTPDERTGWLIPSDDAQALATALAESFALPLEERNNLSRRSRLHARTHFSLAAMKHATLEVYNQRLGARGFVLRTPGRRGPIHH